MVEAFGLEFVPIWKLADCYPKVIFGYHMVILAPKEVHVDTLLCKLTCLDVRNISCRITQEIWLPMYKLHTFYENRMGKLFSYCWTVVWSERQCTINRLRFINFNSLFNIPSLQ